MTMLFDTGQRDGTAEFSADSAFRYTLTRQWSDGECVGFLMFNPSTANSTDNDHTITKCIAFAKKWGYGRLVILNLFAIRSTDPTMVTRLGKEAIGPDNTYWSIKMAEECVEIVCAWGCAQHMKLIDGRIDAVLTAIQENVVAMKFSCLGYRKDGHPRHPLMLSYETPREPFVWRPR